MAQNKETIFLFGGEQLPPGHSQEAGLPGRSESSAKGRLALESPVPYSVLLEGPLIALLFLAICKS